MTNPIQFHLSFNNGVERFQLPVNPSVIRIQQSHGYQDVEAAQLGEYTVIGKNRLAEFSFSSFFPRDYNPTYCAYSPVPAPWDCVNTIKRWMQSGSPVRLTVTGTPINYAVTIRTFDYEPERGGSPGDIYYEMTLKEYVFVNVRRVGESPVSTTPGSGVASILSASSARPNTAVPPKQYTVQAGDTLWKIAQTTLRDGDQWRRIYDVNKAVIGPNPNIIRPGQTLVIPT